MLLGKNADERLAAYKARFKKEHEKRKIAAIPRRKFAFLPIKINTGKNSQKWAWLQYVWVCHDSSAVLDLLYVSEIPTVSEEQIVLYADQNQGIRISKWSKWT